MACRGEWGRCVVLVTLVMAGVGLRAEAQTLPWDVYLDPQSGSECDVVNAANAELVVLATTGQLVIVSSNGIDISDVIIEDSFVELNGDVFFEGLPYGYISFQTDGDGLRSVFWTSLTGKLVAVDGFTAQPYETNFVPLNVKNAACKDACALWNNPNVCVAPPPPTQPPFNFNFNICGAGGGAALALTMVGLIGMRTRSARRRHRYNGLP